MQVNLRFNDHNALISFIHDMVTDEKRRDTFLSALYCNVRRAKEEEFEALDCIDNLYGYIWLKGKKQEV